MQSNTLRITPTSQSPLRCANTPLDALRKHHTESAENRFSDTIAGDDPRWLFAIRVQIQYGPSKPIQSIGQYNDLLDVGAGMGFSDMYARVIVWIVEEAQLRSGLDRTAMIELMEIPSPESSNELSSRGRWITFGVLFGWSLMIAGLMQLV